MDDKSEEYIKGYEAGVRELARRMEVYYNNLKGVTYSVLVAYNVRSQADRIIEGINTYEKL